MENGGGRASFPMPRISQYMGRESHRIVTTFHDREKEIMVFRFRYGILSKFMLCFSKQYSGFECDLHPRYVFLMEHQNVVPACADYRPTRSASLLFLAVLLLLSGMVHSQDLSRDDIQPVTLTGNLVTAAENYSIPGLETQRPVNSARLYFNPTLSIYGLQLPFSFLLSTHERSYNQPFNQFGVSPSYKSLTVHGGYRSLRYSDYTLNDAVFFGAGVELREDWFRVRGMYGRLRRAVDEDSSSSLRAVYKRMGWAFGAGIGDEQRFIDINLLKAWDDSTSLSRRPTFASVFPSENTVVGLNGRLPVAGNRLALDGEIAGSVFSRDIRQPLFDDAGVPPTGLMETRISTRFNLAARAGLGWNDEYWALRLEYARVEPEYETMGAIYTQNDYEDITVKPSFRLPDGKLRINGSIGRRQDNLFDDRLFTTSRLIGSAAINWMPGPSFNIDANYSNYSMSNSAGSIPVNDSTRLDNVSESWSLSPRLMITSATIQHFLMLFVTRQSYSDQNLLTGTNSDNDVLTAVLSYTGTLISGPGFSGALQFTEVNTAFVTNIIRGVTVEVNNSFFDNTLNASIAYTINFTRASIESETDTQQLVTLGARYRFSREDALDFRFQYNDYHAVDPSRRSYSGTVSRLQYSRSFAFGR
jgi:hypothetical protein